MSVFRANFPSFHRIYDRLAKYGVKPSAAMARAFDINEAIAGTSETPAVRLLDLTPDQAVQHVLDKSSRSVAHINVSRIDVMSQLEHETFDAFKDDVDRIIVELRPAFNKAATAIRQAISAGITPGTNADKVLTLEHPDAIKIWKELPAHLDVVQDIADIRIDFSEEIGLEPQPYNAGAGAMNYGACFIKPTGAEPPAIVAAHLRRGMHVFLRPDLHLATQDEVKESLRLERNARGRTA